MLSTTFSWVTAIAVMTSLSLIHAQRLSVEGVHGNGSFRGNRIPMGFPREGVLDLNKNGKGNGYGNTTTWE